MGRAKIPLVTGFLIYLMTAGVLLIAIGSGGLVMRMTRPKRRTVGDALARGWPIDPGELGLEFVERGVGFGDGTETVVWEIRGKKPEGPAVVVTHGWSSGKHQALRHVPGVIEHAWRVIVYDMRGHGESTAKRSRLGFVEHEDLLEIIGGIEGGRAVVLLGSSMGAGVSIAAGARAVGRDGLGGRVVGVIAEGPYRYPMEPVGRLLRCRGLPRFPFVWLVGAYVWLRNWGAYRGYDRAELAGRLECPLLVLHGSEDPVCPVGSARAISEAAEEGELVVFEGAGHGKLAEHDPPEYKRAVERFFTRILDANERGGAEAGAGCSRRELVAG